MKLCGYGLGSLVYVRFCRFLLELIYIWRFGGKVSEYSPLGFLEFGEDDVGDIAIDLLI